MVDIRLGFVCCIPVQMYLFAFGARLLSRTLRTNKLTFPLLLMSYHEQKERKAKRERRKERRKERKKEGRKEGMKEWKRVCVSERKNEIILALILCYISRFNSFCLGAAVRPFCFKTISDWLFSMTFFLALVFDIIWSGYLLYRSWFHFIWNSCHANLQLTVHQALPVVDSFWKWFPRCRFRDLMNAFVSLFSSCQIGSNHWLNSIHADFPINYNVNQLLEILRQSAFSVDDLLLVIPHLPTSGGASCADWSRS